MGLGPRPKPEKPWPRTAVLVYRPGEAVAPEDWKRLAREMGINHAAIRARGKERLGLIVIGKA